MERMSRASASAAQSLARDVTANIKQIPTTEEEKLLIRLRVIHLLSQQPSSLFAEE